MKAIYIDHYGSTDVRCYGDVPRPKPGSGEVLIRTQATSVNPFDCAVRAGYIQGYYSYDLPLVLGLDVAGVVEESGPGVTQFSNGDPVYGRLDPSKNGAYAEYVLACSEEVSIKPRTLDFENAAATPHVALTAWALNEAANLSQGQTVLIHAAAGGVGHMAVQFARQQCRRM
jgi:NADPH:quinone reductase-like Zn-dependent oxidoreductase